MPILASNGSDEGTTTYPASCAMHADMVMPRNALALLYGDNHVCYHVFQNPTLLVETTACDDLPFRSVSPFEVFLPFWHGSARNGLRNGLAIHPTAENRRWFARRFHSSHQPLQMKWFPTLRFLAEKKDHLGIFEVLNWTNSDSLFKKTHAHVEKILPKYTIRLMRLMPISSDIYEHRCKIDYWFGESSVLDRAVKQSPYTEEYVSTNAQDSHGVSPADWWNGETIWKAEDWPKWRHGGMDV